MGSARSQASSGWAVLVTLVVPAIVIEYVLFVLALGYRSRSCSEAGSRVVMTLGLAIVPLLYFLIDRRATRERLWRVMARTAAIALVALLPVAVAYPGLEGAPAESKRRETMRRIEHIAKRLESYAENHNAYPVAHDVAELQRVLGGDLPATDAWCDPLAIASDVKHYSIAGHGIVYRDGSFDARTLAGEPPASPPR